MEKIVKASRYLKEFLSNFGIQAKKAGAEAIVYELIVSIKVDPAPNFIQHEKIKDAADWEIYGEGVYKGRSILTKEEMKRLLTKELCLAEENVLVVDFADTFLDKKINKKEESL